MQQTLLPSDTKGASWGLTRKASVVQMVSTACFLILGFYLMHARPDAVAPSSFDSINSSNVVWLIILMFVVEAVGQTFLGLAGWFSDQPDDDKDDFRDEFIATDTWGGSTHKAVPWCSYVAYLAFLVIIPTVRLTVFCWAVGGAPWTFKVVLVISTLLALSLIYVIVTWQQTFKAFGLLVFFLAPLLSGVALLCTSLQVSPPAATSGLVACGASLFVYFAMFMVYFAVAALKRWHGEVLNLVVWALLAWGTVKL